MSAGKKNTQKSSVADEHDEVRSTDENKEIIPEIPEISKKKSAKETSTRVEGAKKRKRDEISKSEDSESAYSVYIEGLPFSGDEEMVRDFFSDCGTIVDLRLPLFQDTGRLLGYGHVDFDSEDAMNKALAKNKMTLGSRYITVQVAKSRFAVKPRTDAVQPPGCKCVFMRNLPYSADEDQVIAAFEPFGEVMDCRIPRWQHTDRIKGIGFITFKTAEQAAKAVKSGVTIDSRMLELDYETGAPKASFRMKDGQYWFKHEKERLADIIPDGHKAIHKRRKMSDDSRS